MGRLEKKKRKKKKHKLNTEEVIERPLSDTGRILHEKFEKSQGSIEKELIVPDAFSSELTKLLNKVVAEKRNWIMCEPEEQNVISGEKTDHDIYREMLEGEIDLAKDQGAVHEIKIDSDIYRELVRSKIDFVEDQDVASEAMINSDIYRELVGSEVDPPEEQDVAPKRKTNCGIYRDIWNENDW